MARMHNYEDEEEGMDDAAGETRRSSILRFLVAVALLLAIVIAAGSIWGIATGSRARAIARADSGPVEGSDIFDLGQVRAKSADAKAAVIAARISFPYPAAASRFKEELEKKAPALRAAAVDFFSSKKAADLVPATEDATKAGLLGTFNALLSLGKLEEVWLSDFAVLQ
ncbi:MAG TPA: hypothetical protein VMV83_04855 [Rectinemataceae bacterium]|nr:hypothetical protein [Rectinemataceae bacterium]